MHKEVLLMWKNSKGYFHRGILDWEFCNETEVSLPCDLSVIFEDSTFMI